MSSDESPTPPARRGSVLVPVLIAIIVLLTAVSGGGYWWFVHRGGQTAEPVVVPGLVHFDPFLVNLQGASSSRYLRVTLQLLVDTHRAEELEADEVAKSRLRSAILELLAMQRADDLVTPEGRTALKTAIGGQAARAVDHLEIIDVLFTEFVVQY